MEIEPTVLLAYAIAWTFFYALLSRHIAELSRQKWTTWVQSEESDDVLVEALQAVIEEIEDRMHDKLEQFQSSFFGSVGAMTKRAQNLDPSKNIRKAAKDGDVMSLLVEYALNKTGVGGLAALQSADTDGKEGVNSPKTPENTDYLVDYLNK